MRWFKVLMLLLVFFALKPCEAVSNVYAGTESKVENKQPKNNTQSKFASSSSEPSNESQKNNSDEDDIQSRDKKQREREIETQEQMAHYAKLQYYVGVGSLVGLGFTVVFAAIAAYAAWRSVVQAKKSADAAWETVALTKDNSKKQLRAYVGLKSAFVSDQTPKDRIIFEVKITNSGQTPAMLSQVSILGVVRSEKLTPKDFDKSLVYNLSIYLAPNESYIGHASIAKGVPNEVESKISNGELSAYIWVDIHYSDIFGEHQTSTFVRSIEGKGFRFWGATLHANPDYPDEST